jgi:hypothetical protein
MKSQSGSYRALGMSATAAVDRFAKEIGWGHDLPIDACPREVRSAAFNGHAEGRL